MIGSSMMMASFGFMIYAISPAYSNSDKEKTEIKNTGIPNTPVGTNGVSFPDGYIFVEGGHVYYFKGTRASESSELYLWKKTKLP